MLLHLIDKLFYGKLSFNTVDPKPVQRNSIPDPQFKGVRIDRSRSGTQSRVAHPKA
jgi:hypothetical protein